MNSFEKEGMKAYDMLGMFQFDESTRLRASLEDFKSIGLNQTRLKTKSLKTSGP